MTTALFLFGVSLTARWVYLAMNWYAARIHMQMLRDVARAKYRSRTPGGSTYSDSRLPRPCCPRRPGLSPAVGWRLLRQRLPRPPQTWWARATPAQAPRPPGLKPR
jgi:hypothetical protein